MGVAKSRPPLPVGTKLWDAMQTVQESLNQGSGTPEGLLDEAQRYVDPTMQQFCPVTLPEGHGEPDPNFDVRGEDCSAGSPDPAHGVAAALRGRSAAL